MLFMRGQNKRIIIEEYGIRTRALEIFGTEIAVFEYSHPIERVKKEFLKLYEEVKPTYAELVDWMGVEAFDAKGNSKCDTTLKRTQAFCEKAGVDFEAVKAELENYGAYCDCEIIYNAIDIMDTDQPLPLRG